MRPIPRSDWAEMCESVHRRAAEVHAMVDGELGHRTVTSVDYAPFDDIVEIILSTPTGKLRILIDQPDAVLTSESSDPHFAIVVVSNGSSIVLRDAIELAGRYEDPDEPARDAFDVA